MKSCLPIRARGFTLIEMVMVMAVIGILTAIAIPNYTAYIARSNRSEARSQLLMAANWVERWRTQAGSYAGAALPLGLAQSPAQGAAKYALAVAVTPTTYTVTATPVVGGVMDGDVCGALSVNQTGQRLPLAPDLCWGR